MAKGKEVNGNDPVAVHEESKDFFEGMQAGSMGKNRYRIHAPEFATYMYYDSDIGPGSEGLLRGEYQARNGITGADKFTFEFMGEAVGNAPIGELIPREKRIVKKPPKSLIDMMVS